jgi:hypothetical protein
LSVAATVLRHKQKLGYCQQADIPQNEVVGGQPLVALILTGLALEKLAPFFQEHLGTMPPTATRAAAE